MRFNFSGSVLEHYISIANIWFACSLVYENVIALYANLKINNKKKNRPT